jgi:glycosyltransferase involved in cell wall biosynthesis
MSRHQPLVSIITPAWNNAATLPMTLASVAAQSYPHIEHIVVDGASEDATVQLLERSSSVRWLSEPDSGLYDAINKGLGLAQGDVVGVLNADDFLSGPDSITDLTAAIVGVDAVYGDVVYVHADDLLRTVRHYDSQSFRPSMFLNGYMPAHPTFYARRALFEQFGTYRTDYRICADFELLLRFMLIHRITTRYVPGPQVVMRTGGVSNASPLSRLQLNREMVRACRENGVSLGLMHMVWKYPHKIGDYLRPRRRLHDVDTDWLRAISRQD